MLVLLAVDQFAFHTGHKLKLQNKIKLHLLG